METNEPNMAQDETSAIANGLRTVLSFDSLRKYDQDNLNLRFQSASNSPTKPPPASKLAHSADEQSNHSYGSRPRTRTNERPELTRTVSASSNIAPPLVRKASENAMMLRERRLSRTNSNSRTGEALNINSNNNNNNSNNSTPNISPSSSIEIPNGSRFNLMSGAYQRTSQSAGNLILSRPTTPTLEGGSPRGGGSRSGSPDPAGMLPRSASDQTPKKKSVDDFNIGKVLGEGSYGAVVEAVDKETGLQYAIKILEKKHILKENKVKYVTTERDILSTCFHPSIVKLFYTFKSDTSLYYVLELCPNGELLTQIKQYGGMDEECVRFYTAEIVEALEYLHSKGVVHRDLKPENILLSADWHIKLTDFGTAKVLGTERNARSNSFVGTAEYVSPELISTKETSCASDLWALGSIVYQMCANRLPFRGKTEFLTFNKVSSRDLSFPVNFPPLAKDLIENLLVLRPDGRLGAREGGYEELKNHPFFKGITWGSLRDQKPPLLKKPLIACIFDELSPPPSPNSHQLFRTTSAGGGYLYNNNNNNNSNNNSPNNSPRVRANSETQRWSKFLGPDETVRFAGLVWKRKGLSIKKRHLILTNLPRLFYIDPKKMIVRGEIPWSEHLRPELKSSANFNIHTPKRKYILEDTNNNAQRWVEHIQAVYAATKPN